MVARALSGECHRTSLLVRVMAWWRQAMPHGNKPLPDVDLDFWHHIASFVHNTLKFSPLYRWSIVTQISVTIYDTRQQLWHKQKYNEWIFFLNCIIAIRPVTMPMASKSACYLTRKRYIRAPIWDRMYRLDSGHYLNNPLIWQALAVLLTPVELGLKGLDILSPSKLMHRSILAIIFGMSLTKTGKNCCFNSLRPRDAYKRN